MHSLAALIVVLQVATASVPAVESPDRAKGVSLHMLPKRVADLSHGAWGFVVAPASHLTPIPDHHVLQSASALLSFARKQAAPVQRNGIWIVTTDPAAYSPTETRLLESVKALCIKERIPLFIARGSQLPDGWVRYDRAP